LDRDNEFENGSASLAEKQARLCGGWCVCAKEIKPELNTLDEADFVRDVDKSAYHQQSQNETKLSNALQFGEISNSVGSVSTDNCTFNGVSIPRALHSDRNSSTVAGANPE
jgi:hypothetical protein